MNKLKYKLRKIIKKRKNRSLQPINNKVTYSIGTRCTWKEKLLKMENKDYILLYGIGPNIENLTVDKFKQEYFNKPFELFTNRNYVKELGEYKQNQRDNDTEVWSPNLNYVGVAIKKCKVLDTSTIAEDIEKAYKNKQINITNEKRAVQRFSLGRGYQVYSIKPVYKEIYAKSFFTKLVKPTAYIIADADIIVDVAIGAENIQRMIDSFNRKVHEEAVQRQKQAQEDEQEKLRLQAERREKMNQTMEKIGKIGGIIFKK